MTGAGPESVSARPATEVAAATAHSSSKPDCNIRPAAAGTPTVAPHDGTAAPQVSVWTTLRGAAEYLPIVGPFIAISNAQKAADDQVRKQTAFSRLSPAAQAAVSSWGEPASVEQYEQWCIAASFAYPFETPQTGMMR